MFEPGAYERGTDGDPCGNDYARIESGESKGHHRTDCGEQCTDQQQPAGDETDVPDPGRWWYLASRREKEAVPDQRADPPQRRCPCTKEEGDAQVFRSSRVGPPADEWHGQD